MIENTFKNMESIESKDILFIPTNNSRSTWRNFSGKLPGYKGQIPNYGDFNVHLTKEKAEELKRKNFNIREWTNSDGDTIYRLNIAVRFDLYPPKIYLKTGVGSKKKTLLNAETVGLLDTANIVDVDLIVHGSRKQDDDGSGKLKAYLSVGYFTISTTDSLFGGKYADEDEPDIGPGETDNSIPF